MRENKMIKRVVRGVRNNSYLKGLIRRIIPEDVIARMLGNHYPHSANLLYPSIQSLQKMRAAQAKFASRPVISLLVPTYNTDHRFLRECIESVIAQAYDNWQLCIVDDASPDAEVRKIIEEYANRDSRITSYFSETNEHIAGATNRALALAKGEFVGLLDHDDILWPNALYEVVQYVNENKTVDFIYTDEDHVEGRRNRHAAPFFKPDWNPDFLHSVNYITHFAVVRRALMERVGGMDPAYNGAQDWDLFLRLASAARRIIHIPKVLYSWRVHDESTAKTTDSKPYVVKAQKQAILNDLARKGEEDVTVLQDSSFPGYWRIVRPVRNQPLISIVIPTKNQFEIVRRCLNSIYENTTYQNFEIILVDTGSDDPQVLAWYEKMKKDHTNMTVVDWPEQPFSYARACNHGAKIARGELLVMLNNDTEVITKNWLELMAGDAQRQEVGAVGCKLYFPDRLHIQHAGVGIGLGGVAANLFSMTKVTDTLSKTQHLMLHTRHNVTAVTAACLMIKADLFQEVGGFDERYRITYNDVDLCLRLCDRGFRNVYLPYVELIHHESISLGTPEETKKRDTEEFRAAKRQFVNQWKEYVDDDPNINENLDKGSADFRMKARK